MTERIRRGDWTGDRAGKLAGFLFAGSDSYDCDMDNSQIATIAALGTFVVLLIPIIIFAATAAKKQKAQARELIELYRESVELSRKGLETQAEATAVMRELIEALRSHK